MGSAAILPMECAVAQNFDQATTAVPDQATRSQIFAIHAQATLVDQGNLAFRSPYLGANSLSPKAKGRETFDATLYLGVKPCRGLELWINPEIDEGFGLQNTLGVAGFPSGEAYKVGRVAPYFRLQRIFLRQTVDLPGVSEKVDADLNQLAGSRSENRLVFTVGKFSVADVFDTNTYANGPRTDFLNWTVINTGTFDYAADSWGYTAGASLEWYEGRWTARGGAFLLSDIPNDVNIDTRFSQFELIAELEERHSLFGQPGKLKVTGYLNRGEMARLNDAVALARVTGGIPNPAAVRHYRGRPGVSLNVEQQVADGVGAFLRAGYADGTYEAYEFTDVDRTVSGGVTVGGKGWRRPDDRVGLAGVVNQASSDRLAFLAAGGLGILIGDGRLPHPGAERIFETYYNAEILKGVHAALDYQWVTNPAYNRDRGPISIFALRLHGQF